MEENKQVQKSFKDNYIFRAIIISVCVALVIFGRFIPPFGGLNGEAIAFFTTFLGTLILWLFISIDWPSILCIASLCFLPSIGFTTGLAKSFGDSTFIFLMFTFIITYALSKTSFIKRIAIAFVNNKLAKSNGVLFVILYLTAVLILGLFISPSVLFLVMLPITNEIFAVAKIEKGDKVAKVIMLGLGFTVSISSGMTPIAHVFPVIAMKASGVALDSFKYMAYAFPVGLLTFIVMLGILLLIIRPDTRKLKDADLSGIANSLPKVTRNDIITLVVFGLVIVFWILPELLQYAAPDFYSAFKGWGTAMPAIVGACALFIIGTPSKKPILSVPDAFKNGIPWGSLVMCASTLLIGTVLGNEGVGIKAWLQSNLEVSLKALPILALVIIFTLWAALQTNLSSNMVTAQLVSAVAASVLGIVATPEQAAVLIPVVCGLIGMLASFAFATPPSMPHIALVASSDYCSTKDTLIYGSILMIASVILAVAVGYPLGMLIG